MTAVFSSKSIWQLCSHQNLYDSCVLIKIYMTTVFSSKSIWQLCSHQNLFDSCVLIKIYMTAVFSSKSIWQLCSHQNLHDSCVLIKIYMTAVFSSKSTWQLCSHQNLAFCRSEDIYRKNCWYLWHGCHLSMFQVWVYSDCMRTVKTVYMICPAMELHIRISAPPPHNIMVLTIPILCATTFVALKHDSHLSKAMLRHKTMLHMCSWHNRDDMLKFDS